ncbi:MULTISPECIES: ROK family protein [unclassified Actinoplanes]|uniref:ROK family protein n=1 Tax=unclassified Actinoplanes TaxID=2626549 RepID=UPI00043A47E3|nr:MULTISPECIES: ROK family protein [unclassified Actinoplanes]
MTTPVLVFDLGGTWFRVGLSHIDGSVTLLGRYPAISRATHPELPVAELQQRMVSFIVDECVRHASTDVGISIGAAVNGHTGLVLSSAPLWGPGTWELPLTQKLCEALPAVRYSVVNDVSAQALSLLDETASSDSMAAALTVSSGIAYRTIDLASGHIPLDPDHGVQGEIGHLPSAFPWRGTYLSAVCECGVQDHVSAFSSGRAIEQLLPRLAGPDWNIAAFGEACRSGDALALELLDAFTLPLSTVLLYQATLNPQVRHTVLLGGVVDELGEIYRDSVLKNLARLGLYEVTSRDSGYFDRRIKIGNGDGLEALKGAGLYARRNGRAIQ